jgi:hypothetical protein
MREVLTTLSTVLCLWTAPPEYCGRGRPRLHGDKFKLNESETWIEPVQTINVNDSKLGLLQIRVWHNLHFRAAALHPMSIVLVERLNKDGSVRVIKPMWLAWVGDVMPSLDEVWRLYLRRFTVDHWYRFLKQRLHWTAPKFATPKQCVRVACPKGIRWSDLMPMITWELWLARDIVCDCAERTAPWAIALCRGKN